MNSDLNLAGKEMMKSIVFIFTFEVELPCIAKAVPELLASQSLPVSASWVAGAAGLHCGISQPLILTKKKVTGRGSVRSDCACSVHVLGRE